MLVSISPFLQLPTATLGDASRKSITSFALDGVVTVRLRGVAVGSLWTVATPFCTHINAAFR